MAISSGAAYSAVDRLVREVRTTYNPTPQFEQVGAETSAEDISHCFCTTNSAGSTSPFTSELQLTEVTSALLPSIYCSYAARDMRLTWSACRNRWAWS